MKTSMIAKAVALLAIGALQACGGGGSSGGGFSMPAAVTPEPAPAAGEKAAAERVLWTRRALDTVNPGAANGEFDIEVSPHLSLAFARNYVLETPEGVKVSSVGTRVSSAGSFFPQTPTLDKLLIPKIAPGSYVLRSSGIFVGSNGMPEFADTTMPFQLMNQFSLELASFSYSFGARRVALRYTSPIDGTLFIYPTGQATGVCAARTAAELAATPNVEAVSVTGSEMHYTETWRNSGAYADDDTVCLQFVRATDSVAEAPLSFNLRYRHRPVSGDLLFTLDADPAAVDKKALSLVSLPQASRDITSANMFDWIERRQVFAQGDVHQHSTSNSARITLEQAQGTWQYRIGTPAANDHRFYVAKVEGRPPLVLVMVD